MAGTLLSTLGSFGYSGPDLPNFTQAVGMGSQASVVGKAFATVDAGVVPGVGQGTGTGLVGFVPGSVSGLIISLATSAFGGAGPDLATVALAIEQALISESLNASLSSNHAPVFLGVGTVTPGSVSVVGSEWGSNVNAQGVSRGFLGSDWAGMADAIGQGCAGGFSTVTGTVTITEVSHTEPTSPGAGVGSGVVG